MSSTYAACADHVQQLHAAVRQLEDQSRWLQRPPLAGREWFELLERKLLTPLTKEAYLVVAVVGGTNIGKSVIFNHLAGCRASATSPFASGTKHPVCLVPPGFDQRHKLDLIFRGFELHQWSDANAALEDHPEHRLFWRTSENTPPNLLILDTPDIDGDVRVNWERADNIRRCADVLIAVLTQQKYNDAAVKQFFRKAAEEDKAVLVVFNQVFLPEDEAYWPIWLRTFCQETGVRPEFVYLAPADRRAAEENRLSFYLGHVSNVAAEHGHVENVSHVTRNLKEDISSLHFHEIKLRTLRGSLRSVLNSETGVPAYLGEIERESAVLRRSLALLANEKISDHWPQVPKELIAEGIQTWWQSQRQGLTKQVHETFSALSRGLFGVCAKLRDRVRGKPTPPLEVFREREWKLIYDKVESIYDLLSKVAAISCPLLQVKIEAMLSGVSRGQLVAALKTEHDQVEIGRLVREFVTVGMDELRQNNPQTFQLVKRLDQGLAALRPVTAFSLVIFGPAGAVTDQIVVNTVWHVAGEVAVNAATAAASDTALSGAASTGAVLFAKTILRIHARIKDERVNWLREMLAKHLYRGILDELQAATVVPQSAAFQKVRDTLAVLEREVLASPGDTQNAEGNHG